jgi:hypothetical protein
MCRFIQKADNCAGTLNVATTEAVFRCRFGWVESALRATVFLSEHCSTFYFLVQKNVQKLIN